LPNSRAASGVILMSVGHTDGCDTSAMAGKFENVGDYMGIDVHEVVASIVAFATSVYIKNFTDFALTLSCSPNIFNYYFIRSQSSTTPVRGWA